jgi:hypothetical protein
MRNVQMRRVYRDSAIEQNIDVDGAWSIRRPRAFAAELQFNFLNPAQKHERKEIGLALRDEIEKERLFLKAYGLGFVH